MLSTIPSQPGSDGETSPTSPTGSTHTAFDPAYPSLAPWRTESGNNSSLINLVLPFTDVFDLGQPTPSGWGHMAGGWGTQTELSSDRPSELPQWTL